MQALNASLLSVNRALTLGGGLPHLEHLNLSGCLTVTGAGLQDLVAACPSLNDEHFYYCDNINGNVFCEDVRFFWGVTFGLWTLEQTNS